MVKPDMTLMNRYTKITTSDSSSKLWFAGSGRCFKTEIEPMETVNFVDGRIYILVKDGSALWVGTEHELIEDQASRGRYRVAANDAAQILSLDAPEDPVQQVCLIADLAVGSDCAKQSAA